MIKTFKILESLKGVDPSDMFTQATEDGTRSSVVKPYQFRPECNVGANVFRNIVVGAWNKLSPEVGSNEEDNTFKISLDKTRY